MDAAPAKKPWSGIAALLLFAAGVGWLCLPKARVNSTFAEDKIRAEVTGLAYEPFLADYFAKLGFTITASHGFWREQLPISSSHGTLVREDTVVGWYHVTFHYQGSENSPHSMRLSFQISKDFKYKTVDHMHGPPSPDLLNLISNASKVGSSGTVDGITTTSRVLDDGTVLVEFLTSLPGVGIPSVDRNRITSEVLEQRKIQWNVAKLVRTKFDVSNVVLSTRGDLPYSGGFGLLFFSAPANTVQPEIGTKVISFETSLQGDYYGVHSSDYGAAAKLKRKCDGAELVDADQMLGLREVILSDPHHRFPNGILVTAQDQPLSIKIPVGVAHDTRW